MKWTKKILQVSLCRQFLSFVLFLYIKLIFSTNRWTKFNWPILEEYWQSKKPFIVCFWHNRLLLQPYFWESQTPFYMVISGHRDGLFIAQTIKHFGLNTIVGSSSKRGIEALREMQATLKRGQCIGLTPDGPRGPRFIASAGIVQIARLAKVDIVPCAYGTSRRKIWPSWDRFIFALPFGRGALVVGNPIAAPASKEDIERARLQVEQELLRVSDQADAWCGHAPLR